MNTRILLIELKKAYEQLEGKKAYIVSGVIALATFAKLVGWISEAEFQTLLGFLGALGLYTIKSAIKKLE